MERYCKDCVHYLQHYALDKRKIFRVYCGHCTYRRIRNKRPDAIGCENYSFAESREEAFASKEYLSKALLEHLCSLELLPPVENTTECYKNVKAK